MYVEEFEEYIKQKKGKIKEIDQFMDEFLQDFKKRGDWIGLYKLGDDLCSLGLISVSVLNNIDEIFEKGYEQDYKKVKEALKKIIKEIMNEDETEITK